METKIGINNQPSASELWDGIGGHFDSLGQIINEFLDNSISNFAANVQTSRNIIVGLRELADDRVKITVEDTGTGIKDLDAAFTLGNQTAGETPLNEHGFGLKHALASANPANDAWAIYTRTKEDLTIMCSKRLAHRMTSKTFQVPFVRMSSGLVLTQELAQLLNSHALARCTKRLAEGLEAERVYF